MSRFLFSALALLGLSLQVGCTLSYNATATDSDTSSSSGGLMCEDPHAELVGSKCFCVAGYTWCNPTDPNDLSCCEEGATSGPVTTTTPTTSATASGTTTTTTAGTTTGVGTSSGGETTTGETTEAGSSSGGGTTGGPVCPGQQQPPDGCDNNSYWCTSPEACGPADSQLYRCVNGSWVADDSLAQQSCTFDGYDFSYGCIDDGKKIEFLCGDGPGTACQDSDPSTCVDMKTLAECDYGKLTHFDCFTICTEVGDSMGVLYDYGYCGEDMGQTGCLCCDMGEPGCPI